MRLETARSGACRSLKGRRCGVTDRGGFEVVAEYLLFQVFQPSLVPVATHPYITVA